MKYFFSLFALILSFSSLTAQIPGQSGMIDPVDWEASVQKISDNEYQLNFDAEIDDQWHIYSQTTPDGGPLPMYFDFEEEVDAYELEGEVEESESKRQFNDVFGVDEVYFAHEAHFTQKIKLKDADFSVIKVKMSYQVCKEVCIQQEYYVAFNLKEKEGKIFSNYDKYQAYGTSTANKTKENAQKDKSNRNKRVAEVTENKVPESEQGIWTIFIIAFLYGFVALLTPCVFPMIPMTVGFFTKQSKNKAAGIKNALIYGLSIVVIYVFLGTVVTYVFGADALNALSTNVTFNVLFFLLLVVFAVSFLGAFEIMLPNSWMNKVDRKADKGGLIGIFFMALALAVVSFSCTGPIVGTLLVQAASTGGIAPIMGMLGFSLAIAIPFALFALFPAWMNSMPKSGGWLNTVKVFLGFLELALAFKFLSNADLVLQAHFLEREVFLAIWIAIFGTLVFYLFGKIKLPHDSPLPHLSVGRLMLGLLVLAFTIYLIPGLWGSPLKLISGFTPPMNYSEAPYGVGYTKLGGGGTTSMEEFPEGAELGPHDILAFQDYEDGLAYAKKVNKPIFLDFTGFACINCRKMEERVWSEPQVLSKLKNDVVLISLHVDDKKHLPEDEQYTSETTGNRVTSIGNKWSDFQIERYHTNAQPLYIILSPDGKEELAEPIGFTPDVDEFEAWLKSGLKAFEK